MSRAQDFLARSEGCFQRQRPMLLQWQDIADLVFPGRARFTEPGTAGQDDATDIYDTVPRQAMRGLATAIDGLLKPSTQRWFWNQAEDPDLNEVDAVRRYFDKLDTRMWDMIYDPAARFIQHSSVIDMDLSSFGIGYLWIGENRARNGLMFNSFHPADVAVGEDYGSTIDTAYISLKRTARQAEQEWGKANLGKKVTEALNSPDPKAKDKEFTFIWGITPNETRDTRRYDNVNKAFSSLVVCKDDEGIVVESGFDEFPIAAPRWEMASGQTYPRSPAMVALPDMRTLQAMGHTLLVAGQKAADPAIWVVDDGVLSAVRTWPGGLTVVDADVVRDTGGRPMGILDTGKNMPIGREMQADYRAAVEAAFFLNIFKLPIESREMTATEIMERKNEFLRALGPIMGQLENDYPGMIVRRALGIAMRQSYDAKGNRLQGAVLPELPQELKGRNIKFKFMSPIQQARRQIETAGMGRAFEFVTPLLSMQPEAAMNFDADQIVRDMPDAFGLPERWLRSKEDVDEKRQEMQQAQAAQQMAAMAQQGSGAVKDLASAAKSTAQAEVAA